jgi:putative tricarboxylic transport membrane protein
MAAQVLPALVQVLDPATFVTVVGATLVGIVFAAIPGLTGAMAMTLFIPLTFAMEPIQGLVGLAAMYGGANFGGSISAILIRTPGDAPAAATVLDGYEMTKKGEAARALGLALAASSVGGLFGCLVMLWLTPQLVRFSLEFGPAEYFGLAICGLSLIAGLGSSNLLKGIISGLLGLFLATVGLGTITGIPRFTLGLPYLMGGVELIPVVIGLFAVSEVLERLKTLAEFVPQKSLVQLSAFRELLHHKVAFLRSSLIGTWIGILPGVGSTTATFVSYNEAVRWSRRREEFGTGIPEGIIAAEAANNSAVGGSLIPLLALGIPGSSGAAIILAGFMIHGLRPGPLLMMQQPGYFYSILFGMILSNLLMVGLGVLVSRYFVLFLKIPYSIAGPTILLLCLVGIYSVRYSLGDIWAMLFFGGAGYVLRKYDYP